MILRCIKNYFCIIYAFLCCSFIFCEKTFIDGLYKFKLENGLELFVAENHSVPLAYVEIAVKAGAVCQTKETAGLFHLYEHMMFKGNSLYKDAASVKKAMSELGVTDYNGTTSVDCVNYFFTIPSEKLENGLAFWNAAIRTPLITEMELENEKKVVLSEIEGDQANPAYIHHYFSNLCMFPEEPYRRDARGSFDVVRNATIAQLRNMQLEFYNPNNSALFVGGDVDSEEVFNLVKKIYGGWKNHNEHKKNLKQPSLNPLNKTKFVVMPYDRTNEAIAQVELTFRGPDTDYNFEDFLSANYFDFILDDPNSALKTKLASNSEYGIPDPTYVGNYYSSGRADSQIGFYAVVMNPENSLPERARKITEEIQHVILNEIACDKKFFSSSEIKKYNDNMEDSLIKASETAEGLLSLVRSSWIKDQLSYFFEEKKVPQIRQEKIKQYVEEYISKKNPLVTVYVNPKVYEKIRNQFESQNFEEVKKENTVWWEKDYLKVDISSFPKKSDYIEDTDIYVPQENESKKQVTFKDDRTEVHELKNGIKVFIQKTTSRTHAIAISCMGGYQRLNPSTSGLESSLFTVMSMSSKNYSMEKRNEIGYKTGISIGNYSKTLGSVIYMNGSDKYFEKNLGVFVDGFINPLFAENVMKNLNDSILQRVQRIENDPVSLLAWTAEKNIFKGHAYEVQGGVTPESAKNITVENMQELHEKILGGGDFFIVVTGNVNKKKILKLLDGTIGKLEFKDEFKFKINDVPAVKIEDNNPVVLTHPSCLGTAYAMRLFSTPEMGNPDRIPCILAGMIFSDIMYNVVREHYGICYTPYSQVISSRAPVSRDVLFKVSDYRNIGKAMKEAENFMKKGLVVEKCREDGTYEYAEISSCIESYKSKWINSNYESAKTTIGKMASIVSDLMYYENLNHTKEELEQVRNVKSEDVVNAFNKYWMDGNSAWYAITFPGNEKNLKFD